MSTTEQATKQKPGDYYRWLEDQSAFLSELALGEAGPDAQLIALAIRAGFSEMASVTRSASYFATRSAR